MNKTDEQIIKENTLEYFIDLPGLTNTNVNDTDCHVSTIGKEAFRSSELEIFKYCYLKKIEERAFADCEDLHYFLQSDCLVENCSERKNKEKDAEKTDSESQNNNNVLWVEKEAFLNCSKLQTVEFSGNEKIIIEKDAFKGCKSLRTVVVKYGNAMVFENPFESCPDYLTFVCPEDSEIERFAFKNGYRVINEK